MENYHLFLHSAFWGGSILKSLSGDSSLYPGSRNSLYSQGLRYFFLNLLGFQLVTREFGIWIGISFLSHFPDLFNHLPGFSKGYFEGHCKKYSWETSYIIHWSLGEHYTWCLSMTKRRDLSCNCVSFLDLDAKSFKANCVLLQSGSPSISFHSSFITSSLSCSFSSSLFQCKSHLKSLSTSDNLSIWEVITVHVFKRTLD